MRILAVLVLTCLAAGLAAAPAAACSCVARDDAALFASATAVFVGEVVDRDQGFTSVAPVTLTFRVTEVFKGDVPRTQEVLTSANSAGCGLGELQPGTRPHLVFATPDGDPAPARGQLAANLCGGTRTQATGELGPGLAEPRPPLDDPPPAPEPPAGPGAAPWLTALLLAAAGAGLAIALRRRPTGR